LLLALHTPAAHADCTTGGSSCLPGAGYTEAPTWDCGAISTETCYYFGTTSASFATARSWGWGSASYGGTGTVFVCIQGDVYFVGCGDNLARACFLASCDDQDSVAFNIAVENFTGTHTINGHAEA
jgi:hypothetical protein